jgi:hypothetical protein
MDASNAFSPVISLNGTWLIAMDPLNRGREEEWFRQRGGPDARETRVPSVIQETFPGRHGVAWYWRTFTAPRHPARDGRYLLRFHAVDYMAEAWVNGVRVGGHEGGETPFILDATDAVTPGENLLAVRVLNPTYAPIDGIALMQTPHHNKVEPPSSGSDMNHGGIFQPVELLMAPPVRILDVFARPDWRTGAVRVRITVRNAAAGRRRGTVEAGIAPAATGGTLAHAAVPWQGDGGDSVIDMELRVENHGLWSTEDPVLYRLTVGVRTDGEALSDETSVRIGFRDFRVERGFFRLNGKRVFLKSTHTGNCCPVGQIIPPACMPDILRRDLLYAKAAGYNTVRFIAMMALPWQLDMCDEIGLMVYQESYAAWLLADSPDMGRRFDFSLREMVLRDRNHPSLVILGLLNETRDGPVFRHAADSLPLLRSLDDTRLVLLSSGRWDGHWAIGSVSNPGGAAWEHAWGREAPGAQTAHIPEGAIPPLGYVEGAGDAHVYPAAPHPPEAERLIRGLGRGGKPVFLSEYGVGSMMDVVHEARSFEQHRCREDLEDYRFLRGMEDALERDMERWGMRDVYPFAEDLLVDSQERMARHRIHGFDLIRSNPALCGFNLTGILDHAFTGEGLWRLWRSWKPGSMDALQNGWWPVRWCLFVSPWHAYAGRPLRVEAVLANEDVLLPGRYPVSFRIFGPRGVAWERRVEAVLPSPAPGEDPPLAVGVLDEQIMLDGPTGTYRLVADMERGGAPLNRSVEFFLTDPADLPRERTEATLCGIAARTEDWLARHGVACRRMSDPAPERREVLLVGDPSALSGDSGGRTELARRIARGGVAFFLSPHEDADPGWLPLEKKGRCRPFHDWLYHKECVARRHPVFDGLPGAGILDWYYWGPLVPRLVFEDQADPDEVIAASFAAGYNTAGGYAAGVLMGAYRFGSGRFLLNAFPVLENLDAVPAADRMLLNMIRWGSGLCTEPAGAVPADFDETLRAIRYT